MMTNHVGKRISKRQKGKMYEEEGNRERRSEAYLGQSTKKCTTARTAGRVGMCHEMPMCD